MLMRSLLFTTAIVVAASPASAQFYKDKTLTLLVNYAAGGNADTEARVFQRHLARHIPGNPNVIIRNLPGAGGANAMNQLGLGIAGRPDGLTLGFFTMSATSSITDDPVLKVKIQDVYVPIAGAVVERGLCPQGHRARRLFQACRLREGDENFCRWL
jgi:tripartite-type tricarboxylate transporter receptor subunit TctC